MQLLGERAGHLDLESRGELEQRARRLGRLRRHLLHQLVADPAEVEEAFGVSGASQLELTLGQLDEGGVRVAYAPAISSHASRSSPSRRETWSNFSGFASTRPSVRVRRQKR